MFMRRSGKLLLYQRHSRDVLASCWLNFSSTIVGAYGSVNQRHVRLTTGQSGRKDTAKIRQGQCAVT